MSLAHLHLLLNHVPVVGIVGLVLLFGLAVWRRSSELGKAALGLTVALAAVAVVVYLTGEPAEELVERLPGFDEALVEHHEDVAKLATIAFAALGLLAGWLLWVDRGRPLRRGAALGGLAGSVIVSALLAWTANLGGQIRHTEIRAASVTATPTRTEPAGRSAGEAERDEPRPR